MHDDGSGMHVKALPSTVHRALLAAPIGVLQLQ